MTSRASVKSEVILAVPTDAVSISRTADFLSVDAEKLVPGSILKGDAGGSSETDCAVADMATKRQTAAEKYSDLPISTGILTANPFGLDGACRMTPLDPAKPDSRNFQIEFASEKAQLPGTSIKTSASTQAVDNGPDFGKNLRVWRDKRN